MSGSIGGRAAKVTRKVNPQRVFVKTPAAQIGDGPDGITLVTAATFPGQPTATLTAGSSSVAGGHATTWLGASANFAVCVVNVVDGVGGSTAITVGTPTLTGCGMTWSVAGGFYAGHAVGSPDVYSQMVVFTGVGSIADGTLTFGIGTSANARNLAVLGIIAAFDNYDSTIEYTDDGPSATGVAATATLSDPRGNAATISVDGYTVPNGNTSQVATPGNVFLAGNGIEMGFASPAFTFPSEEIVSDGQNVAALIQVAALS